MHSLPATFFDHVRHLYLTDTNPAESEAILGKCNGIQNLDFHGATFPALLALSAEMAPQRLHVGLLSHLFPSGGVDFLHPLFSRVTHFQANVWDFMDNKLWESLGLLPCLTHLVVTVGSLAQIDSVLMKCKRLVALVVLFHDQGSDFADPEITAHFAHDIRVVQLGVKDFVEDWKLGSMGGDDYWSRADAIDRERKLRKAISFQVVET
ncbi:hypothetical protein C8R43DRAFT_1007415 [Mycena crocata]|nr:hypothetical protein C8R43DRAFT_1007415 [Mycena crocata]